MRLKHYVISLIGLFIFPTISLAVAAPQLTLNDAILLALRYNPSVQNAEIQRVIDKFNLRLAKNEYEVNYALEGTANYNNSNQSGSISINNTYALTPSANLNRTPYGTSFALSAPNTINKTVGGNAYYNPGVNLTMTQPLLRGFGKAVNMLRLYDAQDTELVNQLNLKNTIITTITQVIAQYTALAQAKNTLLTQQLALKNSLATLKQYQALIKAGRNAPADLMQFQATVASQQLTLEQQQTRLQQAKLTLLNTLGLDPNTEFTNATQINMPVLALPDLTNSIALALHNNVAYQTQLINLKILKRAYVNAKDQQRWQLDLTTTVGAGGGSGGAPNSGLASLTNGENNTKQVGLRLSIPIDDLNRKQQVVQSKNTLDQAEITLAATKRQVLSDTTNAYTSVLSEKRQIMQAQQAMRYANDNLQIAYAKARYGRISPFEVSSLQSALTDAQIAAITTQENYNNAIANFDQAVGLTLARWRIQLRD
jgi:outer membrane protein TolC